MKPFFMLLLLFIVCELRASDATAVELLVVANSRHISVVVPMSSVPDSFLPRDIDYRAYRYLDLSMGQDPYFYKKDPSVIDGVKALILRSPSVIRLHPFSDKPEVNFPGKNIATLSVTQEQINRLLAYVKSDFNPLENAVHKNTEARKFFYKARSTYSFFNTCVTWIVKGLSFSGLKISQEEIPDYSTMDAFNKISSLSILKSISRFNEER